MSRLKAYVPIPSSQPPLAKTHAVRPASALWLALLLMLLLDVGATGGCSRGEPYVPPDLFYLFATYPVGKNPTSVSTGDFNEDGFTDLITTNISSNSLSLLFGNGDGTFKDQVKIEVGREPRAIALNDYNGDGRLDLAVACSGSDQVAIFLGLANGTFGVGQRYEVHRTPVSIASGDFNSDRKPDLIVALRNDKIKVLLGQGDGTFVDGVLYEYGDTPTSLAVADLNQDSKLDVAVTNGGPMSSAVSIWLGNGDGTFRGPADFRTGKRPLGVSFGDFNNDRMTDLLVINGEMDTLTIFLGKGDGTFEIGKEAGADAGPVFGLARDFDGDHLVDVAIVNIQSNDLSILYGRGDGSFQYPPMNYRTKGGPFAVVSVNMTSREGQQPGLVTANNGAGSISVFLHRGLRSAHTPPVPPS